MRMTKRLHIDTLNEQHDEIEQVAGRLAELYLCFERMGMTQVAAELEKYATDLRAAKRKMKAIIDDMSE